LVLFVAGIGLIFAGFTFGRLVFFSNAWRIRRVLLISGLISMLVSIFGAETAYLVPYLAEPVIACQKWLEAYGFAGYIIVFVASSVILFVLFYENTDFIEHHGVRVVVSFCSALMASRILLILLFIELLAYGFAGLGVLLFDCLFFMIIFRAMQRFHAGAEIIDSLLEPARAERIVDLRAQIRRIQETLSRLSPSDPEYDHYKKELEHLRREMEELQKSL
ncbi:MAG: hypothetical protein ACP5KW_11295, partial [Thermoproteota archaeon]